MKRGDVASPSAEPGKRHKQSHSDIATDDAMESPGKSPGKAKSADPLPHPRHAHHWSLPSHNEKMHPRNKYLLNPPDFAQIVNGACGSDLAAEFAPYVRLVPGTAKGKIDWQDPKACTAVTKMLLERDWGVKGWHLPLGHLVPPVPGRLNHVLWSQDLLMNESRKTHGLRAIDLGVGASLIYPILGARAANWEFTLGLDCDLSSLTVAASNVIAAGLQGNMEVRQAPVLTADAEVGPLSSSLRPEDGNFDVLVCNPPFFGSAEEAARFNKTSKDADPDDDADTSEAANTHEMICDGGEERFLSMLVSDSVRLGPERVRWYVVLVGKKASLTGVLRQMTQLGVHNIRATRFFQGKTVRWGLAWSLSSDGCDARGRPPGDALTVINAHLGNKHRGLPLKTFDIGAAPNEVYARTRSFLVDYRAIPVVCEDDMLNGTLRATLRGAFTAPDGTKSDVHLGMHITPGDTVDASQVAVQSSDGDTWGELAPKARAMVDTIEGEVGRSNRRWRRMLAKQQSDAPMEASPVK
mmetsp:Transcript_36146/g.60925  ORF Transcript_36146/g.60925 Transcript_36146/m.60925 type:complete len:524 (-) Transcript_36146:83-1654(-)|eukprot:CAMPEP_0198207838 /NCGR_PEP_ID=MMETSP1445-20131203/11259_1 /TAXON_ID=36898 /ORGANISM="Pyramimonas sp., Strain CCMP2087" /LENGTH=523 /DNA_ID=CAMNT_0043881005 /DNA_START=128 /DNA_END=1699 /DNA_ORIENTATION=+